MTKSTASLATLLVLLVTLTASFAYAQSNGTSDSCVVFTNCNNCTSVVGCGWCPGNDVGSQCVPGTAIRATGDCKGSDYRWGTCLVSNKDAGIIIAAVLGTIIPACVISYYCMKRYKRKMREAKDKDQKSFIRMADTISSKYGDGRKLDVHKTAHLWK